jgi:hypothetical protein
MNRRVLYGRGRSGNAGVVASLGPAAWFRRGDWTVTGSGISQWNDSSGNARHLLQGTDANRPISLLHSGENYLYLPGVAGNYASTPDSAANSITGDIDIRVRVSLDDWTPSAIQMLAAKYVTTGNQRSFRFYMNTSGALQFDWSIDGVTAIQKSSTSATGVTDGAEKWVRVVLDVDNGASGNDIKFYLSDDGLSWTQLGNTVTTATATSIYDGAGGFEVGSNAGGLNALAGRIYRVIIKNGIDGTTVVDFNAADATNEAASFASSTTGETWTVNKTGAKPAQIVGMSSALFDGSAHFLKCSAFTLNQPTWVVMAVKQVSWTNLDTICDGNAAETMRIRQVSSSPIINQFDGIGNANQNSALAVGAVGVLSALFSGASSFLSVNGVKASGENPGLSAAGGFTLAARGDNTVPSNIQVYEVALFPIAPSAAQQDRVIRYMAGVAGVSL